jgi:hypothetical protein
MGDLWFVYNKINIMQTHNKFENHFKIENFHEVSFVRFIKF